MKTVMLCCIILHNMIVEDEWGEDMEEIADSGDFHISDLSQEGIASQIKLFYLIGKNT
jgi:hypothetical protein